MTRKQLERIGRENPDGFTVNSRGVMHPKKGYAVGYFTFCGMEGFADSPCLSTVADLLTRGLLACAGGWTDSDGHFYLDAVKILLDKERALILARAYRQKAIYGFAEQETIYV